MSGRVGWIGTLAVVAVLTPLRAQDDKDKPKNENPSEQYRALLREYQAAQQEYFKAMQAAKTPADRQEAVKKAPKTQEFSPRFLEIAEKHANDPVAIDSLLWIAQNAGVDKSGERAVELLIKDHMDSPKIGALFQRQTFGLTPGMEKLARAVLEKSSEPQTKRQACLALAIHLKNRRQKDEAEKYFQRIVEEFADLDSLMQVVQQNADGDSGQKAISIILKDHVRSPAFGTALQRLGSSRQTSPAIEKLFRVVLQESDDRVAQGNAAFGLAQYLKSQADTARSLKSADENRVKQYENFYGAEVVKRLKELDVEASNKEIEKLLERVVEEFADVPGARGPLGETAKPELFEIRFLAIGKQAPDIEGEDIDGESFKLSDYRGKVVMLDFWGHW